MSTPIKEVLALLEKQLLNSQAPPELLQKQHVAQLIHESLKSPNTGILEKVLEKAGWTQASTATSGITAYDLMAPSQKLYPLLTPLRNSLPRIGGGIGNAINWRQVTGINTTNMQAGVAEGQRSGVLTHTTADKTIPYRGLGLEDDVTFEAGYSGVGFEDPKALAVMTTLDSLMQAEERVILGGNTSLALGTTPTPSLTASGSGGSLATAADFSVICVALTHAGYQSSSVASGVVGQVTRTNADGTTVQYGGGSAQQSAAASVSVTGPTGSVACTVTLVRGAVGYAWYAGATAGAERLVAITTLNSYVITALNGSGQLASAIANAGADNSRNTLVFDGLMTDVYTTGNGAYFASQATGTAGTGTPLTADTTGGIVEFDTALKYWWDTYKLSPHVIWVSSQEAKNIKAKILTAGANAAQRFVFQMQPNGLMGGSMAISYLNPYGMSDGGEYAQGGEIPIKIHPDLPAGTIFFQCKKLPYKNNNIPNVAQIKTRQEYYQLQWPLRTRKYEYGVYVDEVLMNFAPFAFGIITNVGNG